MSHPKNKRERFLIGKRKGEKRSYLYWSGYSNWFDLPDYFYKKSPRNKGVEYEEKKRLLEKSKAIRRDTTKLCSCPQCGNPRRHFKERTLQEKRYFTAGG